MNELTDEQSKCLTIELCNLLQMERIATSVRIKVEDLIKRYTKKSFPEFRKEYQCADGFKYRFTIVQHNDSEVWMELKDDIDNSEAHAYLNKESFLDFAQAVNKVAEWFVR